MSHNCPNGWMSAADQQADLLLAKNARMRFFASDDWSYTPIQHISVQKGVGEIQTCCRDFSFLQRLRILCKEPVRALRTSSPKSLRLPLKKQVWAPLQLQIPLKM